MTAAETGVVRAEGGVAPAETGEVIPESAVAILLHGGFWRAHHGADLMHPLCRSMTARGWTVWNLEYRRMIEGQPARWPELFLDVAAGIDALPDALGRTPVGPVVAIGHSAGGQLALWAAARAGLPPEAPGALPRVGPLAVVGQGAVADMRMALARGLGRDAVRQVLGDPPDAELERRLTLVSPAERLPLGVPALLVHGALDEDVPVAVARAFAERARAAGDRLQLTVLERTGHFEHLDPTHEAWQTVLDWLAPLAPPGAA